MVTNIQCIKNNTREKPTWLTYLLETEQKNVNLEYVDSIKDIQDNPTLAYVQRTLDILKKENLPLNEKFVIEQVLIWSEVAKTGANEVRAYWKQKGYPLNVHNIASAEIYYETILETKNPLDKFPNTYEYQNFIYLMIKNHGLIGQYLRGETSLPLYTDIAAPKDIRLEMVLYVLNKCIIKAVSSDLWREIRNDVRKVISRYSLEGIQSFLEEETCDFIQNRLQRLRKKTIKNGEDFNTEYKLCVKGKGIKTILETLLRGKDLWYVEAALESFTFEEFIKILQLIRNKSDGIELKNISFERLMKEIHYDYSGKKVTNLYKKRIIEAYLKEIEIRSDFENQKLDNKHVRLNYIKDLQGDLAEVTFTFSEQAEKLIDFCESAEDDPVYDKAIILLYDLFDFRLDKFDRLNNEQTYLQDMTDNSDPKKIIMEHVKEGVVMDIGTGSGVMLDILTEKLTKSIVIGTDASESVIKELRNIKQREKKKWEVTKSDALNLKDKFGTSFADTIIFSSVLHELFSYIEYEGKKFNMDTIIQVLQQAFDVLIPGGRLIIRDGIMTDSKENRIITFKTEEDREIFNRYVSDFKGRKIKYEALEPLVVKLDVNDAMEFLYTFTWGPEAYTHEVQEQFGYFTPLEYKKIINESLGEKAVIKKFEHYLQEGYTEYVLPKLANFTDENGNKVTLPDSTCFIVIEKT